MKIIIDYNRDTNETGYMIEPEDDYANICLDDIVTPLVQCSSTVLMRAFNTKEGCEKAAAQFKEYIDEYIEDCYDGDVLIKPGTVKFSAI